MKPIYWIVLALAAAAAAGFLLVNPPEETTGARPETAAATRLAKPAAPAVKAAMSVAGAEQAAPSADDVARWTVDADSGDAGKRAAAIVGLARAPVEQALPVLRRVLMNGEPTVDRRLALQSLRDLALDQGDKSGAVRNAIRAAIYHGDDLTMTADAQEALDVIGESEL